MTSQMIGRAAGLLLVFIVTFIFVSRHGLLGDEPVHFDQIQRFVRGEFILNPAVTQIPGYHAAVAAIASLVRMTSVTSFRFISLVFSLISIIVFFVAARILDPKTALIRTLEYSFLPILFPYFFFIYTDVLSLLFVLLAYLSALKKRPMLSGIFGALSICVRQANIVWLLFFIAILLSEERLKRISVATERTTASLRLVLRRLPPMRRIIGIIWPFIVTFALFGLFAYFNQGIAVGDRTAHPFPSFNLGNIYFLLFLFFFLFLPLNIANAPKIGGLLRSRRIIILFILLFFPIFLLTFVADHPSNQAALAFFLRNKILLSFTPVPYLKAILFLPVTYSLLSLAVTPLMRGVFYLLYPLTILILLPSWLIEQRYALVFFVFFLLMRKSLGFRIEVLTIGMYILGSFALLGGILTDSFFL